MIHVSTLATVEDTYFEEWRMRSQGSYEEFCHDPELFPLEYPTARAHSVMCEALQAVADGHLHRLMMFAPPGVPRRPVAPPPDDSGMP